MYPANNSLHHKVGEKAKASNDLSFAKKHCIQSTLEELKYACQRSINEEVEVFHQRSYLSSEHYKKRQKTQDDALSHQKSSSSSSSSAAKSSSLCIGLSNNRCWTEILQELYTCLPFITDEHFEMTAHLLSICLLAHVMTQRCNIFKNIKTETNHNSYQSEQSVLLRTLEEILEESPLCEEYSSSENNACELQDERSGSAFWDFLHNGLAPFLSMMSLSPYNSPVDVLEGEKISSTSTSNSSSGRGGSADLLHVLSMIVYAEIPASVKSSALVGTDEHGEEITFESSERMNNLMENHHPRYFKISALQRAEVICVMAESLALVKIDTSPEKWQSLLLDGILHLRVALKAWCSQSLSNHKAYDAKRLLNSIAIDTECFAQDEMKTLVFSLVNDRCKHNPCQKCTTLASSARGRNHELNYQFKRYIYDSGMVKARASTFRKQLIRAQKLSKDICIYCIHGELLQDLILRFNGCRYYADGKFSSVAVAELTAAIATILGQMDENMDVETADKSNLPISCTIIGLLNSARTLFYFLLNQDSESNDSTVDEDMKEAQTLENIMKDALIHCVIQFLGSYNCRIVQAASSFLAIAFAYEKNSRVHSLGAKAFALLKKSLETVGNCEAVREVVEVLSRISDQFAASMVGFLVELFSEICKSIEKAADENQKAESVLSLIVVIASSQPRAILTHFDSFYDCFKHKTLSSKVHKQLIACLLSCRLAQPTSFEGQKKFYANISDSLNLITDPWSVFQLGRHSLCTGNYEVAAEIFGNRLQRSISSSSSYLWLSILSAVANAEDELVRGGICAIPSTLVMLHSAKNQVLSLELVSGSCNIQIEILTLRIDFLDLCIATSNMCEEMRLTNTQGPCFTRNELHQQNLPRCFNILARRYENVYKEYGIFYCQQTRSTLRSQCSLCKFMADAVQKTFSGQTSGMAALGSFPKGDKSRLQMQLINKLKVQMLELSSSSVQPKIQAVALLDIVNTILKCPAISYPQGFTSLKRTPKPVRIFISSTDVFDFDSKSFKEIKVQQGRKLYLRLYGCIPETFFRASKIAFSQVFATLTSSFDGPLQYEGDESGKVLKEDLEYQESISISKELLPASQVMEGEITTGSRFIIDAVLPPFPKEAFYSIDVDLFIRDVRCGEFQLPTNLDGERIIVEVSAHSGMDKSTTKAA